MFQHRPFYTCVVVKLIPSEYQMSDSQNSDLYWQFAQLLSRLRTTLLSCVKVWNDLVYVYTECNPDTDGISLY